MKRHAFTLVELLVVVAIIAALAAILFPVLAKVRDRARMTECYSNLRQLAMSLNAYVQDYDEHYPIGWDQNRVRQGKSPAFTDVMASYVPDRRLWRCPKDIGEIFITATGLYGRRTPPFYSIEMELSSYDYPGSQWPYGGNLTAQPTSRVHRPSLAVLMKEFRPWHGDYDPHATSLAQSPAHYNIVYCDGHVGHRGLADIRSDQYSAFH